MTTRISRPFLIAAIVLVGLTLREIAVLGLPVDFDEPIYYRAGQLYTDAIRRDDWTQLANEDYAGEHPGLVKLLYAAVFLRYPPQIALPDDITLEDIQNALDYGRNEPIVDRYVAMFFAARHSSAFFGVLNVLLVALVNPPAGALLAVHTYTVKYTSQVYLEALPMFTATVAVFAYMRARRSDRNREIEILHQEHNVDIPWRLSRQFLNSSGWWLLSAVALGLTAAGKYIYAVAGLAIAADYLWHLVECRRAGEARVGRGLWRLVAWAGLALVIFYIANPYLWLNPIGRLLKSISFHAAFSQSTYVQEWGLPWYQPLIWLFTSQPFRWHPQVIITPLDTVTAVLAVLGVHRLWSAYEGRGRVLVLWWAIGLVFLLFWRTKWPQYSLIMTVPVCLAAAETLHWVWAKVPQVIGYGCQ